MSRAVLSLGANMGDRLAALGGALRALADETSLLAVSAVYQTEPLGGVPQDDFLNLVAIVDTVLTPRALLELCHRIEYAAGRVRDVRWGPRSLDIDLIAYDDIVSDDPTVTLPHPRAHERAFVLVPWLEADPDAVLPGRGPVAALVPYAEGAVVRTDLVLA